MDFARPISMYYFQLDSILALFFILVLGIIFITASLYYLMQRDKKRMYKSKKSMLLLIGFSYSMLFMFIIVFSNFVSDANKYKALVSDKITEKVAYYTVENTTASTSDIRKVVNMVNLDIANLEHNRDFLAFQVTYDDVATYIIKNNLHEKVAKENSDVKQDKKAEQPKDKANDKANDKAPTKTDIETSVGGNIPFEE